MPTRDALSVLSAEHLAFEHRFAEYESLVTTGAGSEARAELARSLCDALTAHATAEEELFYPAASAALGGDADLIDELLGAHDEARALIETLERLDASDSRFDALVMLLARAVAEHVQQEEAVLFARLRAAEADLSQLAAPLVQRRDEVLRLLSGADDDGPGPA